MKKEIAELIGTFSMVFCGCGAMTINEITGGDISHVGVAITWGLIVMAMIYAFGEISGAHFNPAVTIAFAVAKKFSWSAVPRYIVFQTIGAFLAIAMLWFLFPESQSFGHTYPAEGFPPYKAFILELILTYFLMLVIINVSTGSKEIGTMAAIAVGAVILLEAMFAGPMTKASMNPARSLAPAIISGNLQHLWLYLIAPILGAILAVLSCKLVKDDNCCDTNC
ncbi:aquaporin [Winogradskyella sp. PC-19]|uniref:MIP/aquaporin family protein n=1 Tax=unclassified Winogradskyella TaxID=2615021 RepID=UPI000B3C4DD6|nr:MULTISPECIES: MIP family channel protein [unclassified Winogradskyella]ARV08332.1 aquaporin [Winogradskyella sp. PC-19]RZN79658.1 MAG: MIP family channel protein [Winogradskyella sp.]